MEQIYNYNSRISAAITWLRFTLIFFIIMLHCYSVQRLEGNHVFFYKVLYPFSLWMGETGVPSFFFISGYLFFLNRKTYSRKIETRVHTLLIPYIIWNLLLLVLYVVSNSIGYPQDINGKNLADYNFVDYIRLFWDRGSYDNGNFVPLLCPLWYIRNLLIMSILSPLLYYIIKWAREAFLIVIAFWWMMSYHNAFIPQTVLFFSMGAFYSIFLINPLQLFDKRKRLFMSLFSIFATCDIISHTVYGTPVNLQIHRLSLIFNIPALFLLADYCMRHVFHNQLLSNAAFVVFCVHYPIVVSLRKFCISSFADVNDGIHILLYFVCVIISTLLSLGSYVFLNKFFPRLRIILSGKR